MAFAKINECLDSFLMTHSGLHNTNMLEGFDDLDDLEIVDDAEADEAPICDCLAKKLQELIDANVESGEVSIEDLQAALDEFAEAVDERSECADNEAPDEVEVEDAPIEDECMKM